MGFVKRSMVLESALNVSATSFRVGTDKEYQVAFSKFSALIGNSSAPLKGVNALSELDRRRSEVAWLYNAPGFSGIPVAPRISEPAICYCVEGLSVVDRFIFNHEQLIISDAEITFACVFNHEWENFFPELWFEER